MFHWRGNLTPLEAECEREDGPSGHTTSIPTRNDVDINTGTRHGRAFQS